MHITGQSYRSHSPLSQGPRGRKVMFNRVSFTREKIVPALKQLKNNRICQSGGEKGHNLWAEPVLPGFTSVALLLQVQSAYLLLCNTFPGGGGRRLYTSDIFDLSHLQQNNLDEREKKIIIPAIFNHHLKVDWPRMSNIFKNTIYKTTMMEKWTSPTPPAL